MVPSLLEVVDKAAQPLDGMRVQKQLNPLKFERSVQSSSLSFGRADPDLHSLPGPLELSLDAFRLFHRRLS